MSFSEKPSLKDERRPLLRDPVYHYNHRYGRGSSYDPEDLDELIGVQVARTQRFQWILFLTVTFVSVIILLTTLGVLIRLSQTHPASVPKDVLTTPSTNNIVSTTKATIVSSTTTQSTTPPAPPSVAPPVVNSSNVNIA